MITLVFGMDVCMGDMIYHFDNVSWPKLMIKKRSEHYVKLNGKLK